MALEILVADAMINSDAPLITALKTEGFSVEIAHSGKETQQYLYKKKYYGLILDIELENHSALEVFRYVKLTQPSVRVIFTVTSEARLKALDIKKEDLKNMGFKDVIMKPYKPTAIIKSLNGDLQFELFKTLSTKAKVTDTSEEPLEIKDDQFTGILIDHFFSGSSAIFDIYIRLSPGKYIKILNAGEVFNIDQIARYKTKYQCESLYFKTKDRAMYVHYLNQFISDILKKEQISEIQKVNLVRSATEKFIEEIYQVGFKPQLIEEGDKLCQNIYQYIQREPDLATIMNQIKLADPPLYSHSFLVVFFSSLICSNLDWATPSTIKKIALGGILHDIGKVKLSPIVRALRPEKMNPVQFKEYARHPELGAELIAGVTTVNTEARDIILQHHEMIDGSGFPQGLTGIKIYPLAQVVGFSDHIATIMENQKLTPLEAIKHLLTQKELIKKHNQIFIKAFLNCFLKTKLEIT